MTYQLQGFEDRTAETGYDAERYADTLKDARKQAKYMLSDDYRNMCEASRVLTKIQIWKGEELVEEFYGKEG
jgi:hypothetical protein